MENSHIALTTAHCQLCQHQLNFTTATAVSTLCCHFPPSKHHVDMSTLKKSANNSSSLLLPPSVPMCPSFLQRHNRKMHPQAISSLHHPWLHQEHLPPTPPPNPPAHWQQQHLYGCATHHRMQLLQTILLHPDPNHPSGTIPCYTM
jgi:hypothetical protein